MNDQQIKVEPSKVYLDIEDGFVVFGTPQGVYKLDPSVAVNVANAMLGLVGTLGYEVQVQVEPRFITDTQRLALIQRAVHIMRSMGKKQPQLVASHIVDSVLAEKF